jgi:hypothetical protein
MPEMERAEPMLSKPWARPSSGVDEVDVDAEQIVDGVLIFASVEAAEDGAFLGIVLGG